MKKLNIIYEDKYILVVNKEAKILTIANNKEGNKTLYNEVYNYLHKKNQKCFIVHRLDKDTSGLVIFAKNPKTKEIMQNSWTNTIRKYYAIVQGITDKEGKIESYLKETKTLYTYSSNDKLNGKYSLTEYQRLNNTNKYSLLDIKIKTGRKNQIRVHLNDIHHPIIGDKKYGNAKNPINRLALHAYYLKFIHPITNKEIILEDQIPLLFSSIFK